MTVVVSISASAGIAALHCAIIIRTRDWSVKRARCQTEALSLHYIGGVCGTNKVSPPEGCHFGISESSRLNLPGGLPYPLEPIAM